MAALARASSWHAWAVFSLIRMPRLRAGIHAVRAVPVVVVLITSGLVLAGCGALPGQPIGSSSADPSSSQNSSQAPSQVPGQPSGSSAGSGGAEQCVYESNGQAARPVQPPKTTGVAETGTVVFVITTNEGPITITMDRSKAPCTINSFESLARQKYFDDTRCHRLVDSGIFVLQCGDPTGTGSGGPGYSFADELSGSETYPAGTVAMANSGPNTNGSQFFLVYADSPLPPSYTVFGQLDQACSGW